MRLPRERQVLRAWMLLFTIIVVWALIQNRALSDEGQQARAGLCAFRADYVKRVQGSRAFLKSHPEGIPGIPARMIRSGISDQEKTIRSLSVLDC